MLDRYNKLRQLDNDISIPTGFIDLDKCIGGGFFAGELVVLAGDSGLGKSTLAQQIAINHARRGNTLFCSGEMTVEGLSDREVSSVAELDINIIRRGQYTDEVTEKIFRGVDAIKDRAIYYYRGIPLTVDGIKRACDVTEARYGKLTSVVVDYLQKIHVESKENRYQQLGEVTSELADLSKELDCPVLLLAQLGRDLNHRPDKRPVISDIYESKRIEQDADMVLMLYRVSKYYSKEEWDTLYSSSAREYGWAQVYTEEYPANIAEIIIAKQRQGGGVSRVVKVFWNELKREYGNLREA